MSTGASQQMASLETVRQSEAFYRSVVEETPTLICRFLSNGMITFANKLFCDYFNMSANEVIGMKFQSLISKSDQKRVMESITRLTPSSPVYSHECQVLRQDGKSYWHRWSYRALFDQHERLVAYQSIGEDISDRKRAEDALKESEEKFHSIAEVAQDAVTMLGANGKLIYWNHAAERIFGYTKDEAYGQNLHKLLMPPRYYERATKALERFWQTGDGPLIGQTVEVEALHKDGHEFPVEISISSMQLDGHWHAVGLIRDITERKNMENRLAYLASHDEITGLYNRHDLEHRFADEEERATRYQHPYSIFMVDIDHFKEINDKHGHQVGDHVLYCFAGALSKSIRASDYLARYGGEEFVVILPETDAQKAGEMAERLHHEIKELTVQIEDDKKLKMTASIGVATFPEHGQTWSEILKQADEATYAAKSSGRNCVRIAGSKHN